MANASGIPPTSHAGSPAARTSRPKGPARIALEVVLWAVQLSVAYFMITIGAIPALTADSGAKGTFEEIGFGLWLMYLTGALELLGAIGLITPWFSGLAALGLMCVMAGACLKHLTLDDGKFVETPAMLLFALALVVVGRWSTVKKLGTWLTGGVDRR